MKPEEKDDVLDATDRCRAFWAMELPAANT